MEIASDTVWEGAVAVESEVLVHKGATLLVKPGTTVRFSAEKDEEGMRTMKTLGRNMAWLLNKLHA